MTSSNILQWEDKVTVGESIEEYEYRRYPPNAGGVAMLNTPGEIRFNIESGDIFTHPHRSYLQFEGQLLKEDNSAYSLDEVITIANNAMMYLFSQIRYELGGREIETLLFPGQATKMLGLLEYTDDFQVSKGLNQCWFKDSLLLKEDGEIENEASKNNAGFKARYDLITTSINDQHKNGSFTFNVPLSHIFGFCKNYDKVLYGVKHELILTRKEDGEAIFRGGTVDGKIKLNNLYWFVPQIKPAIGELNTLMEEMNKNINVKIGFDHRQVFSVGLPVGNSSYTWTLTTKSAAEKPRFLVVGFQKTNRNTQTENAAIFNNLNLLEMHVYLNNARRYPALDFQMDFSKNHFSDAFDAAANFRCLVSSLPSCVSNFGINPMDFKYFYPLFVVDISKQSAALKTSVINITVEMKFRDVLQADTKAYAVLLSDKVFALQADGKELKPVF